MIEEGQKKKKRQINDREKEKNRERRYLITRIKRKHSDRLSSFFFGHLICFLNIHTSKK